MGGALISFARASTSRNAMAWVRSWQASLRSRISSSNPKASLAIFWVVLSLAFIVNIPPSPNMLLMPAGGRKVESNFKSPNLKPSHNLLYSAPAPVQLGGGLRPEEKFIPTLLGH